jgi:hypothetical protein
MNNVSFVLGNGKSRSPINVEQLRTLGAVYGCNAIYRDTYVDYLIAVDTRMVLEINEHNYQFKTNVWTNPNKHTEGLPGFKIFNKSKGWSSGPTALYLASEHRPEIIFILGFDYTGIDNKVNNIYSNTKNYKNSVEQATYYGNWVRQTASVISQNENIKYIRVIPQGGFIPKEYPKLGNLSHITIEDFQEEIKKMEKTRIYDHFFTN